MIARSWRWLGLAAPLVVACAQVIGADFEGLMPDHGTTGGSSGTENAGGAAGSTGGGGTSTGPGGTAGTGGGGAAGSSGGSGGAAGNVIRDASFEQAGAGGTTTPDAASDVATADVALVDHQDSAAIVDALPAVDDVVINEIKGQGAGSDWVELHNPGQGPIDLSGFTVAQAIGATGSPDPTSFVTFPSGTTLQGGGFLMVICQQPSIGGPSTSCAALAASCFTVDWGIASGGERIYLLDPEADAGSDAGRTIHQQVDYLATVPSGQTFSRAINGTYQAAPPTPNQPNGI